MIITPPIVPPSFEVPAQVQLIPDAEFKMRLKKNQPVINCDNELQKTNNENTLFRLLPLPQEPIYSDFPGIYIAKTN
jgi:hypothetical protein